MFSDFFLKAYGGQECVGDLPLSMHTAGKGTYVLPLKCGCMSVRQEDFVVLGTGMAVAGIVVCAANQPVVDEAFIYTC
jgi:hypothetical protein